MNTNQLADEFNNTSINLLDLIYSFNNDESLLFYKTTINNLIKINKKKMIELFIINCLEYKDKFENKDKEFFINMNLKNKITNSTLLGVINVKKHFLIIKYNGKTHPIFQMHSSYDKG